LVTEAPTLIDILNKEIGIIETNNSGDFVGVLETIDSELKSIASVISCFGEQIISSIGVTTSNTITDTNVNFLSSNVDIQSLLYVATGANNGLYKISDVATNVITIDATSPYSNFPFSGSTPYIIIQPLSLIPEDNFGFISKYLRETLSFLEETTTFASNISLANKTSRQNELSIRQSKITDFILNLEDLLSSGGLYDARYLWIDQRTNQKEGTLAQKFQAQLQRQEDQQQLIADQQRLLIVENL
jgi:hypothetical protein